MEVETGATTLLAKLLVARETILASAVEKLAITRETVLREVRGRVVVQPIGESLLTGSRGIHPATISFTVLCIREKKEGGARHICVCH